MKKIIGIILIIVLIISLSGCGTTEQKLLYDRFIVLEGDSIKHFYIAYDKDTKVIYYISSSYGGVCPFYNEDGTISVYKEEA